MSKVSLSVCLAFAFFVATAVAQMQPSGGSQGTRNSSPTTQQQGQYPSQQQQPGTGQPTSDQNTTTQNQNNGEHTLKGCVQSQGGSYVLETKKGKDIALTGSDISAHVGHEVAVKGTWEGSSGMSSTASSNAGGAEKTFNVTSVKHISDTCKGKSSSGNMGNSGSTGNSGNTTSPSGTGQSTQPPQQ